MCLLSHRCSGAPIISLVEVDGVLRKVKYHKVFGFIFLISRPICLEISSRQTSLLK